MFQSHLNHSAPLMDGAAEPSVGDRLARSLSAVIDQAEHLIKASVHDSAEPLASARDGLLSQVRQARAELDDLQDSTARRLRRAARLANEALRDHPRAAVGIAAGVGLMSGALVAWLLARR